MKYLIIILIFFGTIILIAQDSFISVTIPRSENDSLQKIYIKLRKDLKKADNLLGQVIVSNDRNITEGYYSSDTLKLKNILKLDKFKDYKLKVKIEKEE